MAGVGSHNGVLIMLGPAGLNPITVGCSWAQNRQQSCLISKQIILTSIQIDGSSSLDGELVVVKCRVRGYTGPSLTH